MKTLLTPIVAWVWAPRALRERRRRRRDRGVALIVVLALLLVLGVIAASTVAVAQLGDRLTSLDRDRGAATYLAESAMARTLWLLRYDCATYPTREMGVTNPLADPQQERFFADGRKHVFALPAGRAEVVIRDMLGGLDLSGPTPDQALKRSAEETEFAEDDERYQRYTEFLAALRDYVDADDMLQLVGGCEASEYAAAGRRPLPRNSPLQYREELLWIRGAREFFRAGENGQLEGVMPLPPTLRMPLAKGKANFFSVGNDQLVKAGFTVAEAEEIMAGRQRWLESPSEVRLEDSFAPELLARLKQAFSFRESGYYTLTIRAMVGPEAAPRILTCSIQLSAQLATTETMRYYEWLFLQ